MRHRLTFRFSPWAALGLFDIVRWHFRQKCRVTFLLKAVIKNDRISTFFDVDVRSLVIIFLLMCRCLETNGMISLA